MATDLAIKVTLMQYLADLWRTLGARAVWSGKCGQGGVVRAVWSGMCGQGCVIRAVWSRLCHHG